MLKAGWIVILLTAAAAAMAQDVLTIGSGGGVAPGGVIHVPVSLRDRSGTPLGAGSVESLQALAFKVTYPTDLVSSVTIGRDGALLNAQTTFESTTAGTGFSSILYLHRFNLPTTSPAGPPPGVHILTLTVTLQPQAPLGATVVLRFDPPSASLSNRSGSVVESVAAGNLTLVNGTFTVGMLGPPSDLIATASSASQVGVTWNAVANADHYEIWRTADNTTWSFLGAPAVASWTDVSVAPATGYLYRVRTVDSGGGLSGYSLPDVATTVVFTDSPLVPGTTIVKLQHVTDLRLAANALRALAGMAPLDADPTLASGAPVRASHLQAVVWGAYEARSYLFLPELFINEHELNHQVIRADHFHRVRRMVR